MIDSGKIIVFVSCLLLLEVVVGLPMFEVSSEDWKQFEKFEKDFKMKFDSTKERMHRVKVFANNLKRMKELVLENPKATFGVNQFTHLTYDEFKAQYLMPTSMMNATMNKLSELPIMKHEIPAEFYNQPKGVDVDWRNQGKVVGIKNQGGCGSCWSFAVAAATESAWAIKHNQLISLSEQNLLDCDSNSYGCNGGFPESAIHYVIDHGLSQEAAYPYTGKQGSCQNAPGDKVPADAVYVPASKDDNGIAGFIQGAGPITITFKCPDSFQHYHGGILTDDACNTDAWHAILLIGFGNENGQDYFIGKNQWGTDWGEQGYVKLRRGVNFCSLNTAPLSIHVP